MYTNRAGTIDFFEDSSRAKFGVTPAGDIGNTGRNFFELAPTFNLDASLSKRFQVREAMNFEIRADVTNLTNTPLWDVPTAVRTSASFGSFTGPLEATGSRKIQLGAKFNF